MEANNGSSARKDSDTQARREAPADPSRPGQAVAAAMNLHALLLTLLGWTLSLAAAGEAWRPSSDPSAFDRNFVTSFGDLPLAGRAQTEKRFWSSGNWLLRQGIINQRWNRQVRSGFNLPSPGLAEARAMSTRELAELSPSEKLDLLAGRYDYPLKQRVARIARPTAQAWEGICHGWAPASIHHDVPAPITLVNPDQITIPFGSADIKGLLSFYYSHLQPSPSQHLGRRCERDSIGGDANCDQDLNAGAFHVVLGNRLGLRSQGIVGDLTPTREVWNHPIYQYKSSVIAEGMQSKSSAPGTARILTLRTQIHYQLEGIHTWEPEPFTENPFGVKVYTYTLELAADDRIIGGRWISADRPDFIWQVPSVKSFRYPMEALVHLVAPGPSPR